MAGTEGRQVEVRSGPRHERTLAHCHEARLLPHHTRSSLTSCSDYSQAIGIANKRRFRPDYGSRLKRATVSSPTIPSVTSIIPAFTPEGAHDEDRADLQPAILYHYTGLLGSCSASTCRRLPYLFGATATGFLGFAQNRASVATF